MASLTLRPAGHPVLDLLVQRIGTHSTPASRTDGARLALVIEGGGMRGVVSGGMATALQGLGARDAFDVIYGTSAGVFTGAYFLAGQATVGTSIYYRHLTGGEFINRRRFLRGVGPLVSIDYLIDVVMESLVPLDYDVVLSAATPLRAVATRLGGYEPAVLGGFASREQLREAMRASSRIPLASGAPVQIGTERYLDGSLTESIPVRSALADGATHVLALLTRPAGQHRSEPGIWERRLLYPVMDRMEPGLGAAHLPRARSYAAELAELAAMAAADSGPVGYALQLPADGRALGQLETDAETLFEAAVAGAETVHRALTGGPGDARSVLHGIGRHAGP